MPRKLQTPTYRLQKPTGQAVVTLNGHDVYLGVHGTDASREAYDRIIAAWLAAGRQYARPGDPCPADLTVNEVTLAYWRYDEKRYTRDGVPARELRNIKDALRHIKPLYGNTPAAEFGPKSLKALRQTMIDGDGLARSTINQRIQKIVRVFRWAVSEELIPAAVYQGLRTVEGLRRGRDGAREAPRVQPVPEEHIEAVLPLVSAPIAAMIRVQYLTGMRPGEVMRIRGCEIDRSGAVWVYRPSRHKTLELGRSREIASSPPTADSECKD
jgi:integrase